MLYLGQIQEKLASVRVSGEFELSEFELAGVYCSPVLIVELGTYANRVVGLSRALRVFLRVLRFSSLRKINT